MDETDHLARAPQSLPGVFEVTEGVFLQVCECAWEHLGPARKAVRATCRRGRTLHDRQLTRLGPNLHPGRERLHDIAAATAAGTAAAMGPLCPTPDQLRRLVPGLLQRGARVQALEMRFLPSTACCWMFGDVFAYRTSHIPAAAREELLLAMLAACCSCPVTSLELHGGIPHTTAVAEAMAACCPQLTRLMLDYEFEVNDLPKRSGGPPTVEEYAAGVVSLLQLVGPRLKELEVAGSAHQWAPQCFDALSHCTRLTRLAVIVGRTETGADNRETVVDSLGCTAAEAQLLASMSTLTQLRSLDLRLLVDPDACSPDTVRPHATCLACLGALTALTRLRLELSDHYVPAGDSWRKRCEEGEEHEAWEEVRGAQRTSLLSALRRMPQLRQLRCSELWLRPSEAASLTALTGLHLGGLLAPPAAAAPSVNVTAAEDTARSPAGALPPQLRMLTLAFGASPSTLAALQPPPSLTELDASCICFGMSDVSPDGRVLPKAVQDFRSAVHLLAPLLPRKLRYPFYILADCGPRPMGPPEAGPRGHVQWMRELAVLDTGSLDLTLKGVQLRVGELACLASALPKVQGLFLLKSHVPPAALPALSGLQQLRTLWVELTHCPNLDTEQLASALCLLCRGASPCLGDVYVKVRSEELDVGACKLSVKQQLNEWGGPVPTNVVLTQEVDDEEEW